METINYASFMPMLVNTMSFTFRAVACALSLVAVMIWWRLRHSGERPPYSRRLNDIAWNWFHAGAIIGAIGFISLDLEYFRVTGQTIGDLVVAVVWWCWANAATVRMSARVPRPQFVYAAATIFLVGGFLYVFFLGN